MLHGVRVRVSPSAPNLKKADFMSAFFMSEIYDFLCFLPILFVTIAFFEFGRILLFLLSRKSANLVRMILSMVLHRTQ